MNNPSSQVDELLWCMDGDRYIGVDLARDGGFVTECEFRRLPDGTLELLDIRETPLPPIIEKQAKDG